MWYDYFFIFVYTDEEVKIMNREIEQAANAAQEANLDQIANLEGWSYLIEMVFPTETINVIIQFITTIIG